MGFNTEQEDLSVGGNWTSILRVTPGHQSWRMHFELLNQAGGNDLADFRISLKPHPKASFSVFLVGSDFSGNPNIDFVTNNQPNNLVAGNLSQVYFHPLNAHEVLFEAKSTGNSTVSLFVGGQSEMIGPY